MMRLPMHSPERDCCGVNTGQASLFDYVFADQIWSSSSSLAGCRAGEGLRSLSVAGRYRVKECAADAAVPATAFAERAPLAVA